jgi:hypothetical protein
LSDTVASALSSWADRFRHSASSLGDQSATFGKDAARHGTAALSQISKEAEQRPLVAIAVALGVGVLIGMAMRNRSWHQCCRVFRPYGVLHSRVHCRERSAVEGKGLKNGSPRGELHEAPPLVPPTVLAADRYRTVLEEGALQLAPEPMQQAVTARLGRIAFELGCERLKERGAL